MQFRYYIHCVCVCVMCKRLLFVQSMNAYYKKEQTSFLCELKLVFERHRTAHTREYTQYINGGRSELSYTLTMTYAHFFALKNYKKIIIKIFSSVYLLFFTHPTHTHTHTHFFLERAHKWRLRCALTHTLKPSVYGTLFKVDYFVHAHVSHFMSL